MHDNLARGAIDADAVLSDEQAEEVHEARVHEEVDPKHEEVRSGEGGEDGNRPLGLGYKAEHDRERRRDREDDQARQERAELERRGQEKRDREPAVRRKW